LAAFARYCFAVNMRRALSRQEGALPVSQSPPLVLIVSR
jgi:hypothetical protein